MGTAFTLVWGTAVCDCDIQAERVICMGRMYTTERGIMVCSHCPTKRPIQIPTKMGCIEYIIICVGVGVRQCEHTIKLIPRHAVNLEVKTHRVM